ncbi:MAG TPA: HD domain-containing protein [Candidatus Bathyarchaeia archaeon]|nr:HD domain-containing protein [Candidatus Bathyarchaeia archaeon]
MNARQRNVIERYAREQMAKLGLHGWPHVKRVQCLCKQLAKSVKEADLEVLEVAALLHDVGKHVEKANNAMDHGGVSAEMAEKFLKSIKFDDVKVDAVCHAIRVHTHGEEPRSVEARVLHDADFLDKMGAVGVATLFIKACLTDTTIEETAEFWKHPSRESYVGLHALWLQKPYFYTRKARNLARGRNKIVKAFFKQLEREIEMADA